MDTMTTHHVVSADNGGHLPQRVELEEPVFAVVLTQLWHHRHRHQSNRALSKSFNEKQQWITEGAKQKQKKVGSRYSPVEHVECAHGMENVVSVFVSKRNRKTAVAEFHTAKKHGITQVYMISHRSASCGCKYQDLFLEEGTYVLGNRGVSCLQLVGKEVSAKATVLR